MVNIRRFTHNPLLRPDDVKPSRPDFMVESRLNPGAFGQVICGADLSVTERLATQDPS